MVMSSLRPKSAALELTLLTVLAMAIVLGAMTWLSISWERSWQLEQIDRGVRLASSTLHSALKSGMMGNRREELRDVIARVARDTRMEPIRIVNHEGRVTISTDSRDVGTELDRSAPACAACHAGKAVAAERMPDIRTLIEDARLHAFAPVVAEPGCSTDTCHRGAAEDAVLGVIDITVALDDASTLTRNRLQLAGLAVAALPLSGVLLWLVLARWFRRPMRDLLRGLRRVAEGDLKHRVPARAHNEFGQLAESINSMSRQLASAQQSLIRSERLISMGKLAAGVAHEINNPLTGILSYAEALAEDIDPSHPSHADCQIILREAMRCRQIVRNLLDFARQDAPSATRVDPVQLFERAVEVVARQARFRNVAIERRFEDDLPSIEADPVQIQQVLVNLIVNAQQAMPEGGTIEIGARRSGRAEVELSVTDYGSGIAPEIRDVIFEPFYSTKGGETDGLGLAVCDGIVQQHGGVIDLESEIGRGTTFRVTLPIESSLTEQGDEP